MLAGLGGSLLLAAGAQGGELVVEQIMFDDAGNALPGDKHVIRVFWQAPDSDDQLVGVVGSPNNEMNVEVTGGTFFDSANFLAGDRPPEFGLLGLPGFEELSFDSWFTVGNTSLDVGPDWPSGSPFSDQVIIAPGTSFDAGGGTKWIGGSGGPDNVAWTVPPSQEDPGGGGVQATPQSVAGNWAGNRIAILQLALDNFGDVGDMVTGNMGLLTVVDGVSSEENGSFTYVIPAPGALALLGLAGIAGVRRRRD
jgi:uncharacterized protein (TIGR03382 family)